MRNDSQRGAITLEACVSVLTFVILLLFLSSLFVMFMAQNVTSHAVLQTSQSLSLDAHIIESLIKKEDGKIGTVNDNVSDYVAKLFGSSENNPYYVTDSYWYNGSSEQIAPAVRTRFIGYLAGGNEDKADELLTNLNVVEGLDGLDFSQSYVEDDVLYIVLKYELQYDFNIWGIGNVVVEQHASAQLWK